MKLIQSAAQPFRSDADRIAFLEALKVRAGFHQGITASRVVVTLDKMIGNLKREDSAETVKAWREMVKLAREGDVEAKASVARIRLIKTNNFLVAMSNWLIFFEHITLENDEAPYWQSTSQQETQAWSSGADGKPHRTQVLKYAEQALATPFKVSTDIVEYYLVDYLKGDIADDTRALVDIARDLSIKIDQKAMPFALGQVMPTWTTTGKGSKSSNVFQLHSAVNTGNIPVGNTIDASGGSATHFGKAAMDLIYAYCAAWGTLFGEVLRPEAILMPSKDATGYTADVTWTSQANVVSQQLLATGFVTNYLGLNWNLIPDVTLDPTAKYCYVKLNKPVGCFFDKPGLAVSRDIVTPESEHNNKGQMWQSNVVAFITPLPYAPQGILRVKYKA